MTVSQMCDLSSMMKCSPMYCHFVLNVCSCFVTVLGVVSFVVTTQMWSLYLIFMCLPNLTKHVYIWVTEASLYLLDKWGQWTIMSSYLLCDILPCLTACCLCCLTNFEEMTGFFLNQTNKWFLLVDQLSGRTDRCSYWLKKIHSSLSVLETDKI